MSDAGSEAYVDADWASQPHRQLMSGYTVYVHGSAIAWSARKQSLITLSTTKGEYIALMAVTREVLHLQTLLNEIYGPVPSPIPIYCDNQGAIALASRNRFHTRTKHIDIRYHFVKQLIRTRVTDLTYCPTEENVADTFTLAATSAPEVASETSDRSRSWGCVGIRLRWNGHAGYCIPAEWKLDREVLYKLQ